MLTFAGCAARQRRLLSTMEDEDWDVFVTSNYRTVYWLTGLLGPAETPTYFVLTRNGHRTLISAAKPPDGAPVNDYQALETYSLQRTITHLPQDAARLLELPPGRCAAEGPLTP